MRLFLACVSICSFKSARARPTRKLRTRFPPLPLSRDPSSMAILVVAHYDDVKLCTVAHHTRTTGPFTVLQKSHGGTPWRRDGLRRHYHLVTFVDSEARTRDTADAPRSTIRSTMAKQRLNLFITRFSSRRIMISVRMSHDVTVC
jgi:hypothetical protein